MDSMPQFWGTAIGAGVIAAIIAGVVALRHGKLALMGVSLRDFPGVTGVTHPLEHRTVYRALRRAAGGWRVVWVIGLTGLVAASANVAWDVVVPATWHVQSVWMAILRAVVCVPVSMWVVGRILVASIHRHMAGGEADILS